MFAVSYFFQVISLGFFVHCCFGLVKSTNPVDCCQFLQGSNNSEQLFHCINDTSFITTVAHSNGHQRPRVALMTRMTASLVESYAGFSALMQMTYAAKNGYAYIINDKEFLVDGVDEESEDYELYPKLSLMLHALDHHPLVEDADYLVWMDAGEYQHSTASMKKSRSYLCVM